VIVMPIPEFRPDGYLPEGVHMATEEEVTARFGQSTPYRQMLMARVSEWLALARAVGASRFLVDGSFVTTKPEPGDVDAVCWLPSDFGLLRHAGHVAARRLAQMLETRLPEELFGAFDIDEWNELCEFFGRTYELDGRRKGVVEVIL
jgi:hypothetical protein